MSTSGKPGSHVELVYRGYKSQRQLKHILIGQLAPVREVERRGCRHCGRAVTRKSRPGHRTARGPHRTTVWRHGGDQFSNVLTVRFRWVGHLFRRVTHHLQRNWLGITLPRIVRASIRRSCGCRFGFHARDRALRGARAGYSPSHCGSSRRIRSSSGGWVANMLAMPLAKYMWLASAAHGLMSFEPNTAAPIRFSAPAMPSGLRVNCTAEASARYSRCRETAALMRLPNNRPKKPTTMNARPISNRYITSAALL